MTPTTSRRRQAVLLTAVVALALAVTACGKKSGLSPPEGEEELYTYPRSYPAPSTVRPQPPLEAGEEDDPSFLQPFGRSRSTTTTTGPVTQ